MNQVQGTIPRVVIVGGGASGALVAAQLARQATYPLDVTVVEPAERLARGLAYSTRDRRHVLNVPARGMSALPDSPDHFARWAGVSGVDFVARERYGDYLASVLAGSWRTAPDGSRLQHLRERVVGLQPLRSGAIRVATARGAWLYADRVVLATGHGAPLVPAWLEPVRDLVVDPWAPGLVERLGAEAHVMCVGSGLTAVDAALGVLGSHSRGRVTLVSRRGLLPHAHVLPLAEPAPPLPLPDGPLRLRPLIEAVRASGDQWRATLDGLRPVTQEIWQRLTQEDRQAVVTHFVRYWDVHRHRMAPEVARRLDHYRHAGRLRVVASTSPAAIMQGGQGLVTLGSERIRVDAVLPCTGPEATLTSSELGADLADRGLARPGPFDIGVDCDPVTGALVTESGDYDDRIRAIGPLRRGVLWESTAVPEIREQAAAVAGELVADLEATHERLPEQVAL